MVERLKAAIEKARQQRAGTAADGVLPESPVPRSYAPAEWRIRWGEIPELVFDASTLPGNRVVTYDRSDPVHVAFDILRTRILKVAGDNGWRRIGITSPTLGCGKTTIAANLAFSFARHRDMKVIIADFDLRAPRLARSIAAQDQYDLGSVLNSDGRLEDHAQRIGENLLLLLNSKRIPNAAEWMLSPSLHDKLDRMITNLSPDLVLIDLPPLLAADDTLAVMPRLDAMLLVSAAGKTRLSEIDECERLISERTQFLGVILNRHESEIGDSYQYHQEYGAIDVR